MASLEPFHKATIVARIASSLRLVPAGTRAAGRELHPLRTHGFHGARKEESINGASIRTMNSPPTANLDSVGVAMRAAEAIRLHQSPNILATWPGHSTGEFLFSRRSWPYPVGVPSDDVFKTSLHIVCQR